jgi:broad specificity phosphatase PhoE
MDNNTLFSDFYSTHTFGKFQSIFYTYKMITDLYIIRHGETDWNKCKRFQGHTDIELNETGIAQANALQNELKKISPDVVLSSDLARAKGTALLATKLLDTPIIFSDQLREAKLGVAEGKTYSEVKLLYGEKTLKDWFNPAIDMSFEEGELKSEAQSRAITYINGMIDELKVSKMVISTHGLLILRLLFFASKKIPEFVSVPNGKVFHIRVDNKKWELLTKL